MTTLTAPRPTAQDAPTLTAGVYVRISDDRNHDALGVARQEQDCRALCAQRGITDVRVYVDDDRSAYSGKLRPAYERMLSDIEHGDVQLLVAWHPDRLHRSPSELERFIIIVEAANVSIETCRAGTFDLTTPTGRMVARIVGDVARHESEHKSDRIKRKMIELAENGVMMGGTRAFAYGPETKLVDAKVRSLDSTERKRQRKSLMAARGADFWKNDHAPSLTMRLPSSVRSPHEYSTAKRCATCVVTSLHVVCRRYKATPGSNRLATHVALVAHLWTS